MYDTTSGQDGDCALYVPCSRVQLAHVGVCVIVLVDVVCVMLVVLIAHVDVVHVVDTLGGWWLVVGCWWLVVGGWWWWLLL